MRALIKNNRGFTIVELLIVIVVIGILAAIVISTYSGVQVKQHNSTRQTDIQALQTDVERYYSNNGYYPTLGDMNSPSWRAKDMPYVIPSDLVDPSAKDHNTNVPVLVATPTKDAYSYDVTNSNGGSCESNQTSCAKYILTATFQGTVNGLKTYVKQNLD